MSYKLEICAFNLSSALNAAKYPITRIELCDGFEVGGTTPSYGMLVMTRNQVAIPVYPIIRPRGGDFLYSDEEFEMMLKDIELCKSLGYEGISTGVQLADGSIDEVRMKEIVKLAYPMGVTCHRVFDSTPDPFKALETLKNLKVERILTSGQQKTAIEGAKLIRELVEKAENEIEIMAGAGVLSSNIKSLAENSKTSIFHATAKKMIPAYQNPSPIIDAGKLAVLDEIELQLMIKELNQYFL